MSTPNTPLLVYICYPYAAYNERSVEHNVAMANMYANDVAHLGHIPIIPHNYYYCRDEEPEDFWKALDMKLLAHCNILYFPSGRANPTYISPGCRAELRYAFETNMPVVTCMNKQNIYGSYNPDAIKNF